MARGNRQPRLVLAAIAAVATLMLAACGDPSQTPDTAPTPSTTSPGGVGEPGSATTLVTGLEVPWGLAFLADGDALLTERLNARLLRITPQGEVSTVASFSDEVRADGEGGLLGVAVSPREEIFVYLTTSVDNRVAQVADGALEPVLTGIPHNRFHNGGRIAFGPDGALYVTTGDAGRPSSAQDTGSLAGKILRILPDGSVPQDNPFPGSPVYSLGHRNVQGLAWDDRGRLFATEFGSSHLDEVNIIEPGGNYGWPLAEGPAGPGSTGLTDPVVTWPTSQASPSGAAIVGDTLYVAALRGRRLWAVPLTSGSPGEPIALLTDRFGRLRTVAAAPDGRLWLTTSNRDGRGDPVADDDRVVVFEAAGEGTIKW